MNPSVSNPPPAPQPPSAQTALELDPIKLQAFQQQMKDEQNLPLGFVAGSVAAVLGTILWAIVTVITDYQIGWMAIGIGLAVGFAVRYLGKGVDRIYGFVGAGVALLSCLAGNLLTSAIVISRQEQVSLLEVLLIFITSPGVTLDVMVAMFSPIDLFFYGLASYEGYKFSFRQITQAEKASLYRQRPSL